MYIPIEIKAPRIVIGKKMKETRHPEELMVPCISAKNLIQIIMIGNMLAIENHFFFEMIIKI